MNEQIEAIIDDCDVEQLLWYACNPYNPYLAQEAAIAYVEWLEDMSYYDMIEVVERIEEADRFDKFFGLLEIMRQYIEDQTCEHCGGHVDDCYPAYDQPHGWLEPPCEVSCRKYWG